MQDLEPGVTHYVSTRADGYVRLVENDAPALETPEALRARIDAALAALKVPHPEQPYNAWVNSGNRWTKAAHEARIALGADS